MSQDPSAPRDQVLSQLLRVDPRVIDALVDQLGDVIVQRLLDAIRAEGLNPRASEPEALLDANEVADRLRMSREWVYEHAEELGVSRMGDGPRPRLRFPPHVVEARRVKPSPSDEAAARRAQRKANASGLIPIRGS
jgi:predicted DNA-binding transcriptional regulator AlpA